MLKQTMQAVGAHDAEIIEGKHKAIIGCSGAVFSPRGGPLVNVPASLRV